MLRQAMLRLIVMTKIEVIGMLQSNLVTVLCVKDRVIDEIEATSYHIARCECGSIWYSSLSFEDLKYAYNVR